MLPKLSERAAMRATAHIRRHYPDWLQAKILHEGSEGERIRMEAFIRHSKEHLADLRNRIAEGETPCIDTGWPVNDEASRRVRADADSSAERAAINDLVAETAPEPQVIERIVEVENTERLDELESRLKAAQEALAARPETVIPDTGPEPIEASYDEPPAEIADLIDPSLTPRQNLDVLTAKFAAAKNLEEYARDTGDKSAAMKHLKDAERFESGIKWNRAVLVEVV